MKRIPSLLLAALIPAVAGAQFKALDAAKDTRNVSAEGNARIERAADAALQEGNETTAAAPGQRPVAPARVEGAASAADGGQAAVPPPDAYTIRPGDTLWDLSGRFLNNPWYWPKVWSFNPEITNPHWIEPGNVLRFYPSAEEAPLRVEPATPAGIAVSDEPEEPAGEPPRELEDFSRADMRAPQPVDEADEVAVAGPYRIGFVAPRTVVTLRDTFVTPREVESSGSLVAAFEEKLLLSTQDRAYATFKNVVEAIPGETYVVYRTERKITHPLTGELMGYQSKILGTAKAVAVDKTAVTGVITHTLDPIERGDLLGPWADRLVRPVPQRPNARDVAGTIVGAQVDILTMLGEQHVVFIDKGKADGVEEGNVFRAVRSGDPYGLPLGVLHDDPNLPLEIVGDLLVIDVKEQVSTALVTRSLRELALGDRVEMRAAGGAGGN
jgi:hypothetical protein